MMWSNRKDTLQKQGHSVFPPVWEKLRQEAAGFADALTKLVKPVKKTF